MTTVHTPVSRRDQIDAAAAMLHARLGSVPEVAIVLGSGLGGFTDRFTEAFAVPYRDIPHWPGTNVVGHAGRLVAGGVAGRRVLALSGRAHLYEGHEPETVVFPTRVLARAGVRTLVLTNAAGGIRPDLGAGTLMVIDDHINLTGRNPLVGSNDEELGPRFPDMSEVYSRRLRSIADESARACGLPIAHGVYLGVLGPSYETPAEIRAFRVLGADAVGMSTVSEAIVGRHMGLEVLGVSCIANAAAGLTSMPLNALEVVDVAERTSEAFGRLLEGIVVRL